MKPMKLIASLLATGCITSLTANAATTFNTLGGNIETVGNWTDGLPTAGNEGSIGINGIITSGPTALSGIINLSANLTTPDNFNFLASSPVVWNMTGGNVTGRFILINSGFGGSVTFNMSGGTWNLNTTGGTRQFGVANSGIWNISGSAVIDDLGNANTAIASGGTINIGDDWTGSFDYESYKTSGAWQTLFTNGTIKYDGATLTAPQFTSTFNVDGDGTLTLIDPVPEPSSAALLGLGSLALVIRRRRG